MTDIIPKASSGRYMGISNVATATNGVIAGFIGAVIVDRARRSPANPALGPRLAFLMAPFWFADRRPAPAAGRRSDGARTRHRPAARAVVHRGQLAAGGV